MKDGFEHKRKVPEPKDTKKKKKGRGRENTEMEEEKDDQIEEEENSNQRVLRRLRKPPAQFPVEPRVTRSKRPKETVRKSMI